MSYNVIGDIAGNYKTLLALLNKMPKGKVIAVGDIVDRGPNSKEVVEYFMREVAAGNADLIMGNHEHMMIDFYRSVHDNQYDRQYDFGIWQMNGGDETEKSFGYSVPSDVIEFLSKCPTHLNLDLDGKKCYISHAFRSSRVSNPGELVFDKIWNRREPWFPDDCEDIQICGHNSQYGLRYWKSGQKQAICIDTSRNEVLTGIHLPTLTIYQQEYID